MNPQAPLLTPPPHPPNGGAVSLSTLLSVWEADGQSDEQLDTLCRQHPDLAAELRSQASALRRVGKLLRHATTDDTRPRVPGYELLRVIGEGGMGTVWEARQLSANRHVALKLLPLHHLGSARAQARFEREVELASRLDHPHIARLYDSGLDRGVYYFSMELVAGRPIDEHPFPSLRVALETLILVAHALTHAHGRGVLHRDLKPSNLLVSSDQQPHLLDFGLARDLTADSKLTLELPFAGTPGYCAPEQARGQPSDVTGDTFSLGLIAIRVLLGRHPLDLTQPPQKLLQQLGHQPVRLPPIPPGTRLPPDLLAVLRKAVAFDPADRYASADAFASDLQAVLDHRPVSARRPSLAYSARRFLYRNRRAVAVAAAVLTLTAGVGTYVTHRVLTEQSRAARSAQVAAEANRFLTDLLTAANPQVAQGRNLTLRDLLDTASTRIAQTQLDPEVEAHLRQSIGMTLFHIGQTSDYPDAVAHLRQAVHLRNQRLGPRHPDTLSARSDLGRVLIIKPDTEDEGFAIIRDIAEDRLNRLGPAHPDTQNSLFALASSLHNHGRFDELESFLRRHKATIDNFPNLSPNARLQWQWLAAALDSHRGDHEGMLHLTSSVLQQSLEQHGTLHTETARAYMNHGIILRKLGRFDEAHNALNTAVQLRTRIMGPDHADTSYARIQLAIAQANLGRVEQAREQLRIVLNATKGSEAYHDFARIELNKLPPTESNQPSESLSTPALPPR